MISTVIDDGFVRHIVAGPVDVAEAERGSLEGRAVLRSAYLASGAVGLLMDLRQVGFAGMEAHRAWSDGFARNADGAECAQRVALLGRDSLQVRAEQAAMETERVRFFFEEGEAVAWLRG